MTNRTRASWLVYVLGALCAGALVTAILIVGPTSQSAAVQRRVVTVADGVVQSTVSGSGNIEASSQLDLGFKTSGVVQHIYVSAGEHVSTGELIAELDPQSAEVTLEQARARLQSAEASLAQEEEDEGESTGAQGSGEGSANAAAAAVGTSTAPDSSTPGTSTPSTSTSTPQTTITETTPASSTTGKATPSTKAKSKTKTESTAKTEARKQSAVTREANLASAEASVRSDHLAVESDEQAVQDTKLYAPNSGTIVSLGGEVGETVSGSGTSKASASSESSASGGSGSGGGEGAAANSGASSSSAFAVLTNLNEMQLVVPLSEAEIVHVRVGQPATVTVEALEGTKLAAEVSAVATLPSSTSGVVDYDVTFSLEQLTDGLKPGMSASAEVVVKQAKGVNVPTRAISGATVTVVHGSSEERRSVVTGLAGDSTTIVSSGLKAGEEISLPISSTSSSTTSLLSRLGSKTGGAAGFGAGGGGFAGAGAGGGGGAPVFRGGG
jgi:multidrug efflux pump subunit AcrA (membrane-fusion protein)